MLHDQAASSSPGPALAPAGIVATIDNASCVIG